ncbi:MAG: CapA family protein [bacterium]
MRRLACLAAALLAACGAPPRRLWLAGDVQLDDATDPAAVLAAARGLRGAGVVNLEGPVGAGKPGGDRLRNGPAVLAALEAVGVAAVTVANNHAADDGPAGLAATRAAAGPVAVRGELASATVAGVEVLAAYEASPEALAAAVQARAPAPVFVTLHVLAPPSYRPSAETRARVEAALAAGAAVVAVHGSHALGAVERRGRQVVAWGLGNLAFACRCTTEDEAMALEVTLSDGEVDAVVVPLRAGLHGAPLALDPDPQAVITLLEALGSSPLDLQGDRARLVPPTD